MSVATPRKNRTMRDEINALMARCADAQGKAHAIFLDAEDFKIIYLPDKRRTPWYVGFYAGGSKHTEIGATLGSAIKKWLRFYEHEWDDPERFPHDITRR